MILAWHRSNQTSKGLHYIPGAARYWQPRWSRVLLIPEPADQGVASSLHRARSEAAREQGKDRLGSISKQDDRYLRSLFVAGALAVIRYAKRLQQPRGSTRRKSREALPSC